MQPGNYVYLLLVGNKWMVEKSIWILTLPASALVLWRLYSLGLHNTYRFFFAYLAVAVLRTTVLLPFSPQSRPYYEIWAATQPVILLLYILIVSELYSLVLHKYPGIYSLGRWFFFGAVAGTAEFWRSSPGTGPARVLLRTGSRYRLPASGGRVAAGEHFRVRGGREPR